MSVTAHSGGWRFKLTALLGSLLLLLLIFLIGELAVRAFVDINFQGNSRNLFVANAYGSSTGNAPDVEAVSFGAIVYTDGRGFRVPKGGLPGDEQKGEAILLLGDSVGFGPAVEEGETFAGLLRARFPTRRVYNSSVIGYAVPDYKNVVDAFMPQHPEVTDVVLVFTLNDVSPKSAENIDRYLKATQGKPQEPERNLTATLRGVGPLQAANDFMRERSKLYLLLKDEIMGVERRGWDEVSRLYAEGREAQVAESAREIGEIAAALEERNVRFVIVLAPAQYQLTNPDDPATEIPQRLLSERLSESGVVPIDARSSFDRNRARDYFLLYDQLHFSSAGHRVMADVIARALVP